jgi:allantoicase
MDFIESPAVELPVFAKTGMNLADSSLNAVVLSVTDEFFAPRERMLNPAPARFYPGLYDDNGKWMDGWETRRRRNTGHDWCVIRLAYAGTLLGVDFDTSFFSGNFPPAASLEGCFCASGDPDEHTSWVSLIDSVALSGNQHHFHAVDTQQTISHVRLHIWPDGGMARLRIYGLPWCNWENRDLSHSYDLIALENGGRQIAWRDAHYGEPRQILKPGRGKDMGDGWETRRRREPGNEWCILALGQAGTIEKIEIDTAHFKGNFPDRFSIQAAFEEVTLERALVTRSMFWPYLITEQPLTADSIHTYINEISKLGKISHVRLNSIPDGGISRLRLWGKVDSAL